jgi:adenosine deaminase
MEVRDSNVVANTARAVEQTATTTGETVQTVQDTARQILKAAPKTFKAANKANLSIFQLLLKIMLCLVSTIVPNSYRTSTIVSFRYRALKCQII